MSYRFVIYETRDSVAYITLNRPQVGNVINNTLAQELKDICDQINQDDAIRVAIIRGAGDKAFCLGNELEYSAQTKTSKLPLLTQSGDLVLRHCVAPFVSAIDCPVIAAINGDALGAGLELALACDLRIAVNTAHFGLPYISSGLMPMDGGTQRLPRLISRGKSLEMILTGNLVDAQEALQIGLVNKVLPSQELVTEVDRIAQKIKEKAPIALRFAKEAINKGLDLTLEQGLRLEADLYFLLHTTHDRTEGISAFRARRSPHFHGK